MNEQAESAKQAPWLVIILIVTVIISVVFYYVISSENKQENTVVQAPVNIVEDKSTPKPEATMVVEPAIEALEENKPLEELVIEEPQPELPPLDDSDLLMKEKLPSLTWRKELLRLVITKDLIRRFVVFTDNFSQGELAYAHSPFESPHEKFSAIEYQDEGKVKTTWYTDESLTRRFALYIDLLRSFDSEMLVEFYFDIKPLIDEAYEELGYPEGEFTEVLQASILRVLDIDIPREPSALVRPSVMYKYKDEYLESLPDADKLLLRIGYENMLMVKSILLEINDKISKGQAL